MEGAKSVFQSSLICGDQILEVELLGPRACRVFGPGSVVSEPSRKGGGTHMPDPLPHITRQCKVRSTLGAPTHLGWVFGMHLLGTDMENANRTIFCPTFPQGPPAYIPPRPPTLFLPLPHSRRPVLQLEGGALAQKLLL